jgi:hypothetical protein
MANGFAAVSRTIVTSNLFAAADVSFGSNSEVELADADFRFTPESRHPAVGLECPFRANKRHRRHQALPLPIHH